MILGVRAYAQQVEVERRCGVLGIAGLDIEREACYTRYGQSKEEKKSIRLSIFDDDRKLLFIVSIKKNEDARGWRAKQVQDSFIEIR